MTLHCRICKCKLGLGERILGTGHCELHLEYWHIWHKLEVDQ